MYVVWIVLGGETTPCFQGGCCMKVWAMSQFCYQVEVQPRVQPFSALMLCCPSSMRMRQVKMHFLQPSTPSDVSREWISLFVQSVDCADRKCFRGWLLFSFSQSLFFCSLHWFGLSRSFPDTHEGLHASCPSSADRDSVWLSISARLHPVPLQLWSLPGLQVLCLSAGGFTELPPQYCDQVCHCAR